MGLESVANDAREPVLAHGPLPSLQCSTPPARSPHLFLKSLDISGFKSFARSTRLEFPPGITALVGPNGSGKSNVVDAVRWVLGEQSPRDLRGRRTEDVIYAGPRKVLGAAEVELVLEAGPSDVSSLSDVSVARRLYRSGESEYLVNRRRARLKDVLDVLRYTGIGAPEHVIVTQGMTDGLLSASPGERRALLEQASGLAGYRARRDDARQKLATVFQNIATGELVLAELGPRVKLLRRQARALEERDEAARRLTEGLHAWHAHKWSGSTAALEAMQERAERHARARSQAHDSVARLEEQAETLMERERVWQQRLEVAIAALATMDLDLHAAQRDVDHLEQRRADACQSLEEYQGRRRQRIESMEQMRTNLNCAEGSLRREVEQHEASLAERQRTQADVDRESEVVHLLRRSAAEVRSASMSAEKAADDARRQLGAARARLETDEARSVRAAADLEEVSGHLAALDRELSDLGPRLAQLANEEQRWSEALDRLRSQLHAGRNRVSRIERVGHGVDGTLARLSADTSALRHVLNGLVREIGLNVAAALTVERGWEDAVTSALGSWGRVRADGSSGSQLRSGDLSSFLTWRRSLERMVGKRVLWADAVAQGFPPQTVNPLCATLLVEGDGEAREVWAAISFAPAHLVGSPQVQVVTRAGRRWSATGVRPPAADDPGARYLRAKRELADLERRRAHWEGRKKAVDRALDSARETLAQGEREVQTAEEGRQTARAERLSAEDRRDRITRERDVLEAQRGRDADDLERVSSQVTSRRSEVGRAVAKEAEARRGAEGLRRQLDTAVLRKDEAEERYGKLCDRMADARRSAELLAARAAAQSEAVARLRDDLHRTEAELLLLDGRITELQREAERIEGALVAGRRLVTELAALKEDQEVRLGEIRRARPDLVAGSGLQDQRARLTAAMADHERAMAELARMREEHQTLADEIWRDLRMDPASLSPAPEDVPTDDEIRRLRVRAAQALDLDESIRDEYCQLAARQEELEHHIADLRSAATDLEEIMRVADAEMRARFDQAFQAVGEEFSRVFSVMLQGGEARLELVDDGGVEIQARLPGKRSRSSAAFSGGERALVACSLLFGVLRIRPAPFCILDEVDAALDESNVDRYLAVLREASRETQMVVVTHNRATMEAADVLYGVTMNDEGMSALLSLRLDTYDQAG